MEGIGLEPLPGGSVVSTLHNEVNEHSVENISEDELFKKVENHLLEKIKSGDKEAPFLLGQFYYEEELPQKAAIQFDDIKDVDYQAAYQLATMYFDGVGVNVDYEKGMDLMMKVATSKSIRAKHLIHSSQYNVGRAYFDGYGVQQSDGEAEKWWLLAADDGNPKASIHAQTMLGMLYSRPDFLDLKKAFFWHSEACGNGSLESQGILGVMYAEGLGIAKNEKNALECLKEASQRGNVYAQGRLVQFYYEKKLFTKACDLARRVVAYNEIERISQETSCLPTYIIKGITLACIFLSRCLKLGNGIRKDEEEAKKYFHMACEHDPALANESFLKIAYGLL
ncbi:LRP2-binding protein-like [Styela clava]